MDPVVSHSDIFSGWQSYSILWNAAIWSYFFQS